ncbi:MAG: superoxide dismutase [Chloroflexi bacterium]|nr:superoxide dismutase [Chloroflexota bacterium]
MPRQAKELKPGKSLEGLSDRQIAEHHDVLYKGYVNKLNEIEEKVPQANLADANATYSLLRELKREEVFATDAIRLHEGYFMALGGAGKGPTGKLLQLIQRDFGSFEQFQAQFLALGLCARGWVVLAYDWEDGKLHTYLSDIHSDGVWNASPLLILDVYEHAYFIDYGTARKRYLESWFKNVNWDYVGSLLEKYRIAA